MTLEEVKSQTPALLLPYAEAVHQAMVAAELSLGSMNLPERKRKFVPSETGNGEEGIDPLDNQVGE